MEAIVFRKSFLSPSLPACQPRKVAERTPFGSEANQSLCALTTTVDSGYQLIAVVNYVTINCRTKQQMQSFGFFSFHGCTKNRERERGRERDADDQMRHKKTKRL